MSELGPVRISVVIPTFNRPEALRDALAGLQGSDFADFEVLVMDQSDDTETENIVAQFGDARMRHCHMNRRGACPARNAGAAMAHAPLVAFLDDDCVPDTTWLSKIVAAFADDAELDFIFGRLSAPEHDWKLGGYPSFEPATVAAQGKSGWRVAMVAAGANMSCRRRFLERWGGFDELLGPEVPGVKGNDSSIAYKVWRSGVKWAARDDINVLHLHGFRELETLWELYEGYAYGLGVNYGRFVRRGDLRALGIFFFEQLAFARRPLSAAIRLRKPSGTATWLAHIRGLFRGLTVAPRLGYVDGASFRQLEAEGEP